MKKKKIIIINLQEFEENIDCKEKVKRVYCELENGLEIHNNQIVANYSDEGFACFKVVKNTGDALILDFIGTAC